MVFKYVIGVYLLCLRYQGDALTSAEHMEEDEDTTRAIPPWVELEYAVCKRLLVVQEGQEG